MGQWGLEGRDVRMWIASKGIARMGRADGG